MLKNFPSLSRYAAEGTDEGGEGTGETVRQERSRRLLWYNFQATVKRLEESTLGSKLDRLGTIKERKRDWRIGSSQNRR